MSVLHRRNVLGIASPDPQARPWTNAEEALLGTMTDEELAKKLDRSKIGIGVRRQRLNVPIFAPLRQPWSAADDALFRKFSNGEIVRRLGRTLSSVQNRRFRLARLWV